MSVKNKLLLIFLQPFLFLSFYLILPPLVIQKFPGPSFTSNKTVLPLISSKTYQSEISFPSGYLKSATVIVKNPGNFNYSNVTFGLKDYQGEIIEQLQTNGHALGDPYKLTLVFSKPILASTQPYKLFITTNNTNAETFYVYAASESQLNFQTQIIYPGFRDRFSQNLVFQYSKFQQLDFKLVLPWLFIILLCNLLLLKTQPPTQSKQNLGPPPSSSSQTH